jgi:hypothetical protein
MKLFIIHWELNSISEDNIVIYGFGYSEDHTQVRLAITDFVPYKYSRMIHKDFSYKSEQKYVLREYDKGIQKLYKHYFTNAQEYNCYDKFFIISKYYLYLREFSTRILNIFIRKRLIIAINTTNI